MSIKQYFPTAISTFNREKFPSKNLDSVLVQYYLEPVLCAGDDASTEGTRHIMESNILKDTDTRLISEPDSRHTEGTNIASDRGKSLFDALLYSHDILRPEALATAAELFETTPEISNRSVIVKENGKVFPPPLHHCRCDFACVLCREYLPSFEGVFFSAALPLGGRFNPKIKNCAFYNIWLFLVIRNNVIEFLHGSSQWRILTKSTCNNFVKFHIELLLCQRMFIAEHHEALHFQHFQHHASARGKLYKDRTRARVQEKRFLCFQFNPKLTLRARKLRDMNHYFVLSNIKFIWRS